MIKIFLLIQIFLSGMFLFLSWRKLFKEYSVPLLVSVIWITILLLFALIYGYLVFYKDFFMET